MHGEWEVVNRYMPMNDPGSVIEAFIGSPVFEYTVRNTSTGETRMVKAQGEFDD